MTANGPRESQAVRRARSRAALLEAAARRMSNDGYASLVLEQVARDAGYTRGALYHQFANKEELAIAVVTWVGETWQSEVGSPAHSDARPVDALLEMARRHAVFCRRDVAGVLLTLRVEFSGSDHPAARAIRELVERLDEECAAVIAAGRDDGSIPAGPPARETAAAFTAVIEAVGIELAGKPYDVELIERAARGVLGLPGAER